MRSRWAVVSACTVLAVAAGAGVAPAASSTSSPASDAPVIVIDPGHSRTVVAVDRRTGLRVSDYENEPEMRDVYDVALRVGTALRRAGYRVVLTKSSLYQRRSLAARAAIANAAHAALALSIHDQAGRAGGIGFRHGNNIVYYQVVGDYRATPGGHHVVFTDRRLAAVSKRYAALFGAQRRRLQRVPVSVRGNVGYDLGTRGLAPGNIWIVQLLSRVPWIYNEAGGNSTGRSGLDAADRATYAASLVASVEACVPRPTPTVTALSTRHGSTAGTTRVTLHGHHFLRVQQVYFGTTRARSVRVLSPTVLQVTAPGHGAGIVAVRVRTPYGTSPGRSFRYESPPPTTVPSGSAPATPTPPTTTPSTAEATTTAPAPARPRS